MSDRFPGHKLGLEILPENVGPMRTSFVYATCACGWEGPIRHDGHSATLDDYADHLNTIRADYVVGHIDGDPHNNDISNLRLEPRG